MLVTQVTVLYHLSNIGGDTWPKHWLSSSEDTFALPLVSQVNHLEDLISHGSWYNNFAAFEYQAIL